MAEVSLHSVVRVVLSVNSAFAALSIRPDVEFDSAATLSSSGFNSRHRATTAGIINRKVGTITKITSRRRSTIAIFVLFSFFIN